MAVMTEKRNPADMIEPVYQTQNAKIDGPKFGTARPAAQGPVPRFVDGLERVSGGAVKRYRVACLNYRDPTPKPARYIVAKDKAEAVAFYRKEFKIDAEVSAWGKDAPTPDIVAVEQPD